MLTLEEARGRVARGAGLLDTVAPGWAQAIDLGMLRLDSCGSCILGQLFGDYIEAYRRIGVLRDKGGAHYGFDVTIEEFRGLRRIHYGTMTQAWLEAIADRIIVPEPAARRMQANLREEILEPVS